MNRDEVMRWVARYEQAWREGDLAAVEELFTDDARYLRSHRCLIERLFVVTVVSFATGAVTPPS